MPQLNEEPDIDTGSEAPLLMAKDLHSLLELFEARERLNHPPASPPRPSTQTIRDALPPEVINRIKVQSISNIF